MLTFEVKRHQASGDKKEEKLIFFFAEKLEPKLLRPVIAPRRGRREWSCKLTPVLNILQTRTETLLYKEDQSTWRRPDLAYHPCSLSRRIRRVNRRLKIFVHGGLW